MTCKGLAGVALPFALGVVLIGPLAAQQASQAADYWIGMGRFPNINQSDPKNPPDLSGTYQVKGAANPGAADPGAYETTMTLKRKKTIETPQGAKIATYDIRYNWDDPVEGIAVFIGHRLYLAYGSKNIALNVGAPLVLTPEEARADEQARAANAKVTAANRGRDRGRWTYSKGAPWFAAVHDKDKWDLFHRAPDSPGVTSGFYTYWFEAKGLWGEEFYFGLNSWGAGSHRGIGYILEEGNERCMGGDCIYGSELKITPDGKTLQLQQSGSGNLKLDGTGRQLDDGTVVWVMGGGKGTGAGYYEFGNGALTGPYWGLGANGLGTETLTPDPKIVARTPTLFTPR